MSAPLSFRLLVEATVQFESQTASVFLTVLLQNCKALHLQLRFNAGKCPSGISSYIMPHFCHDSAALDICLTVAVLFQIWRHTARGCIKKRQTCMPVWPMSRCRAPGGNWVCLCWQYAAAAAISPKPRTAAAELRTGRGSGHFASTLAPEAQHVMCSICSQAFTIVHHAQSHALKPGGI